MPTLDTVPAEILREIGDYLAFFDKVSLSLTSKICRAKLGAFDCPDHTSWAAYLCLNAPIYPPDNQIYLLPKFNLDNIHRYIMQQSSPPLNEGLLKEIELLEFQLSLYYRSYRTWNGFRDPNTESLRLEKPTKWISLKEASASYKPDLVLIPYFPGLKYPENTLAQLYLSSIIEILKTQGGGGKEVGRPNLTL